MNSRVNFIPKTAALDLWEFGEDEYVDRALLLSNEELELLGERTYKNFNEGFLKKAGKAMPKSGYDIGLITALTLVEYFEGTIRPLKRSHRRGHAELPKKLEITREDYIPKLPKKNGAGAWFKSLVSKVKN